MASAQDHLFQACMEADAFKLRDALEKGGDANSADHEGSRPIHLLLWHQTTPRQRCACLEVLLKSGLRMNMANAKGQSGFKKLEAFPEEAETFLRVRGQAGMNQVRRHQGLRLVWWEERAAALRSGSLNERLPSSSEPLIPRPPRL